MCVDLCGTALGMMSCQEQARDPLLCLHASCSLCAQLSFRLSAQPRLTHLSHPLSLSCLNGPPVRASGGSGHNPTSFPDPTNDCWRSGRSTKTEVGGHPAHEWPGANAALAASCLLPGAGRQTVPALQRTPIPMEAPRSSAVPGLLLARAGGHSREVTSSEAGGRQVDAGPSQLLSSGRGVRSVELGQAPSYSPAPAISDCLMWGAWGGWGPLPRSHWQNQDFRGCPGA